MIDFLGGPFHGTVDDMDQNQDISECTHVHLYFFHDCPVFNYVNDEWDGTYEDILPMSEIYVYELINGDAYYVGIYDQ